MVEDIAHHDDDDHEHNLDSGPEKVPWYLIDTNKTASKAWEFLVSTVLIWSLAVTPFSLVFQCIYSCFLCEPFCDSKDVGCVSTRFDKTCEDTR